MKLLAIWNLITPHKNIRILEGKDTFSFVLTGSGIYIWPKPILGPKKLQYSLKSIKFLLKLEIDWV